MSAKPETVFTASINRLLKDQVYFEKMHNPFRAGTADYWYSGDKGDLWVEYKFTPSLPRSNDYSLNLTPRQVRWLTDRHEEGRTIAVILGVPNGGIVFPGNSWNRKFSTAKLQARVLTRKELAAWVLAKVGTSRCVLSRRSPPPQL